MPEVVVKRDSRMDPRFDRHVPHMRPLTELIIGCKRLMTSWQPSSRRAETPQGVKLLQKPSLYYTDHR